jgi:ribonucleoside-diphosphate reductase alpha chain
MQLGRLPLCQLSYSRPGARRTSRGASKGTTRRYRATGATSDLSASRGAERTAFRIQEDAPSCADFGSIMIRNGSCYKCLNCGSTSSCS